MSSYEPYIASLDQHQNQNYTDWHFHIPRYAAPDLDPTGPLPEADLSPTGGQYIEHTEDRRRAQDFPRMSEDENGAGPSRKRARASGSSSGNHGVSQNGHGGGNHPGHNGGNSNGHAQQRGGPTTSNRPVPPSIFGMDARNDLLREIADWLLRTCEGRGDIEIEIKLGKIVHRNSSVRLQIPDIQSEKPLYTRQHVFSSDMLPVQHATLNKILNSLVENPPDPSNRLRYKRIKQKDTFYQQHGRKIRVSSLAETGEITEVIQKEKVDHLDIYCPAQDLDLRISVNTETPCTVPGGEPTMVRTKDRISYSHSVCQTDLTWVTGPGPDGVTRSSFEVEVEVVDVKSFLRDSQTDPVLFDQKLQCCLDTARILIRNAS